MDTTLQDPLVGRVLDGRYRVESRLARGGMATVYAALNSRLDRTIALKVMHPALAEDDDFVSRFIREARSAARLSHPNVVAVYDQGADGNHVFLAMEHVAGRTLRDLLRERGRLTPRQALDITEAVLAALGAAHQAGIVHRDVKPENVLLADDGRVKVADFGLARAVTGSSTHSTTTGILMGTVAYLSPEQVERGVADPRSDVYSVGILLFEMLTGEKPFDGETAIQVAYRHVHDDVPPPSDLVPGLPAELDGLVAHATCRDPDGRPVDAHRFLPEVVRVRRGLDDADLDHGNDAPTPTAGTPDHTLVVPLDDDVESTPARRGDTGPLPPAQRRSRRGWIAFLVIIGLAAALSGAAWYVAAGPGSYTNAPSLLGLSQSEAKAKANRLGFTMQVTATEFSESVPADHVISTDPAPNERIRKDGTIAAVVSKGPERYAVPAVLGKAEEAARRLLIDGNLSVGVVKRKYSDTVEEGRVIATDPRPGTRLKPNAAVALVLSKGVMPVAVPDVVGKSESDARAAFAEAKLEAEVVSRKFDDEVPAGAVISQAPANGTVPKGSAVQLVVSKGPPLVEVPNVVGMPVDEATRVIEEAGLKVNAFGPSVGRVFSQRPGGGSSAPRGSTITLFYI